MNSKKISSKLRFWLYWKNKAICTTALSVRDSFKWSKSVNVLILLSLLMLMEKLVSHISVIASWVFYRYWQHINLLMSIWNLSGLMYILLCFRNFIYLIVKSVANPSMAFNYKIVLIIHKEQQRLTTIRSHINVVI